ncbi:MAG: hypothetical protein DBX90_09295 [Lentisphaerae bacterium]|nr:MAG: hypothetical protein DBX90_09295 [Lentisphaerota bacterium]
MESRFVNSLVKVFEDSELDVAGLREATALRGEVYSLQFAFRSDLRLDRLTAEVDSPLAEFIRIRRVESVPVRYFGPKFDADILRNTPGLYPDLLTELAEFRFPAFQWHALWITIRVPRTLVPGSYPLQLRLRNDDLLKQEWNTSFESEVFMLHVLPPVLPEQTLLRTEWLHTDCVFGHYDLIPWSEEHWTMQERYFRNMTAHGINVVYTPLFTPPLDTQIGGERPTAQLVRVIEENGVYRFDFSHLERWIRLAKRSGFRAFELSHLFTQWGARFTPKIIIEHNGMEEKRFGWHIAADSAEYRNFLDTFLPRLRDFLRQQEIEADCLVHISDEPHPEHLESYAAAVALVRKHLDGMKFLDALSDPDFYEKGLVGIPVPGSDHLADFERFMLPERWVYYCCSQWNRVSNQFIHFPSCRNRIMGVLMYVAEVQGFLQWGYNFYHSQFSRHPVDPYRDTEAGGGFPGGDSFKVYPGPDGPEDSIRHEVFFEGLQDMRALQLLESLVGREETVAFVVEAAGCLPDMCNYPRSPEWLPAFREALNRKLAKLTASAHPEKP